MSSLRIIIAEHRTWRSIGQTSIDVYNFQTFRFDMGPMLNETVVISSSNLKEELTSAPYLAGGYYLV